MAAVRASAITEDFQQRFGVIAGGNRNYTLGTCQGHQFSGLLHITVQKNKKLGGTALGPLSFITQYENVAGEQRHYFFRLDLLADAGHA
jgi:hypothetical protein